MGGEGIPASSELGEFELSAVQEAMNQMMGSASTSMSDFLSIPIDINPPNTVYVDSDEDKTLDQLFPDKQLIQVRFDLKIGDLVHSNIMQVINIPFAKQLANELLGI
jgi:flagellar motor switch protein FliN/FliY